MKITIDYCDKIISANTKGNWKKSNPNFTAKVNAQRWRNNLIRVGKCEMILPEDYDELSKD